MYTFLALVVSVLKLTCKLLQSLDNICSSFGNHNTIKRNLFSKVKYEILVSMNSNYVMYKVSFYGCPNIYISEISQLFKKRTYQHTHTHTTSKTGFIVLLCSSTPYDELNNQKRKILEILSIPNESDRQ